MMGRWLTKNIPATTGKILEVRGLPGNSVDRDRHRRLPRDHGSARQQVRDHRGRRQLGRRHGAEGDRRRARRARQVRRHVRAGRLDRRGARADGRRPSVRPGGRRGARTASASCAPSMRRTACCARPPASRRAWSRSRSRPRSPRSRARCCRSTSRCRSRYVETPRLQGRRQLLARPDRQLLHAERVPAVRRQHQRRRKSWRKTEADQ